MNVITKTVQLPDGRTISIETGKVAKQADGSVVLRMNNTVLLATVTAAKEAVPGTDFMPVTVDYREKYYATGRFPGGFTKREGKATDEEILISRLVDRALRPLFPSDFHCEVFVQIWLLSSDGKDQPDALAGFAASAAMACSTIPFEHTISECRVARINGEYVIDPTFEQMKDADLDIMVGCTKDNLMMVEGEMSEVQEHDLVEALKAAQKAIVPMCELQDELAKELGTDVKREYNDEVNDEDLRKQIHDELYQPAYDTIHKTLPKQERNDAFDKIIADFIEKYDAAHTDLSEEDLEEKHAEAGRYWNDVLRDAMRRCVLDEGLRMDGRKTDEVRPIWCETSPLPMPHGSAIFQRGETMSLATVTLGTKLDEKMVDGVVSQGYSASCSTTTSHRSPLARQRASAAQAVVRSVTATWLGVPSRDRFPQTILTPCVWYQISWSLTALLQWQASAAELSPSWMPACQSRSRWLVSQWASSRTLARTSMPFSLIFSATRTTSATWTSRPREQRTDSLPHRWISSATASHSTSSRRLSCRLRPAASTSWAR